MSSFFLQNAERFSSQQALEAGVFPLQFPGPFGRLGVLSDPYWFIQRY